MVTLLSSYAEANRDSWQTMKDLHPSDSANASAVSQSFTTPNDGINYNLDSCKWFLMKVGSPLGNAHACLYTHSGVYGTSSVPTGAVLATSDNFDVSTISAVAFTIYTFTFSGAQRISLTANTKYCITFEEPTSGTINTTNYVEAGEDTSGPTHDGNWAKYQNGAWSAAAAEDNIFYVYGEVPAAGITLKKGGALANTMATMLASKMLFSTAKLPKFTPRIVT